MKKTLSASLVAAVAAVTLVATAVPSSATTSSEKFDHVDKLVAAGWTAQNNSDPQGTTDVFQGNKKVFKSHDGKPGAYLAMNYHATGSIGTISDWLVTPKRTTLSNGDAWSIWSRGQTGQWVDRLEIRMSTDGSCDPGTGVDDVGDFTTVLQTINPDLTVGGYPSSWTKYSGTLSGLDGDTTGCLAFRYYVTDGGELGANSNYIGLDTYSFADDAVPNCSKQQSEVKDAKAAVGKADKAVGSAKSALRKAQHTGNASAIAKAKQALADAQAKDRAAKHQLAQAAHALKVCQAG